MKRNAKIMSRRRSISRGFFALALVAAAFVACSSTSGGQACSPGDSQGCACPDGSQGLSTCEASGAAYAACVCGADAGIKDSGITWSEETFKELVKDPRAKFPDTKMFFAGTKDEAELGNLWAYLKPFGPDGKKK